MSQEHEMSRLEFYGGKYTALLPFAVLLCGIVVLAANKMAGTKPFWACGFAAILVGLFLAKNKDRYCGAIMKGIAEKNGIVIIVAWLFASVLGKLMVTAGMVKGILWLGLVTGVEEAIFTVVVFISASLFSIGTGSANGTAIALSPVLYPAGLYLGADPVWLALAIMSGGALGDNLAPISDTTIVSAYSQDASMTDVVKSRFPLVAVAGAMCIIFLFIVGGGGVKQPLQQLQAQTEAKCAFLLIALFIVVISALKGRHIIESLTYGIISAIAIGLCVGTLTFADLFHIPAKRGDSTGILQDGINDVVGPIIFVILIMASVRIFIESGLLDDVMRFFEKAVIKTVRQAEVAIVIITAVVSAFVTANAPTLLLVGPTLVKPLGEKFNLAPARRANLIDCTVCSIFYMFPWVLAALVWYNSIYMAAESIGATAPPITICCMSPYSWALILVMAFSIITGWNRRYGKNNSKTNETATMEQSQP